MVIVDGFPRNPAERDELRALVDARGDYLRVAMKNESRASCDGSFRPGKAKVIVDGLPRNPAGRDELCALVDAHCDYLRKVMMNESRASCDWAFRPGMAN
eukprot:2880044-Heterocapsa_arctica.AAC.1